MFKSLFRRYYAGDEAFSRGTSWITKEEDPFKRSRVTILDFKEDYVLFEGEYIPKQSLQKNKFLNLFRMD